MIKSSADGQNSPFLLTAPQSRAATLTEADLIELAIKQSGIENAGDTGWLKDTRIRQQLMRLARIHGERDKKYDPDTLSMTHPLWVAHANYNSVELNDSSVNPLFAAFCGLIHDDVEELVYNASKAGVELDPNRVYRDLQRLWDEKAKNAEMTALLDYMTDDFKLPKEIRIQAQYNKSIKGSTTPFSGQPVCNIPPLFQLTRFNDKQHQLLCDAALRRSGKLDDRKTLRAAEKAKQRVWVCLLPAVSEKQRRGYLQDFDYMQREAVRIQFKNDMRVAANFLGRPVLNAIGRTSSRLYRRTRTGVRQLAASFSL